MKRTISSVLALAMVAALLAIFAGAANAQSDTGKGQITAVNGLIGHTVDVVADDGNGTTYDLGKGLGDAAIGTPTVVEPGDYKITFSEGGAEVASYQLKVDAVTAWNVVSGYADSTGNSAAAYAVNLGAATPAVVFDNSSDGAVTVTPGDISVDLGKSVAAPGPDNFTITTASGAAVGADLSGVASASYSDVVVVGTDATPLQASVTIADLAALKKSLEPGTGQVTVPDVAGKSAADAQTALEDAGFTVTTQEQDSETVEAGLVIETNPSAGTEVAAGTEVKMIVSTGFGDVAVPDVAGKSAADAQTALEDAGFTVTTQEQDSETVEAGLVIETNPSAGTEVAAGTEVKMIVSTGFGDVAVPDVAGKSAADAQTALEDAGFTVTTQEQDSETVEAGLVIETNPSAGTEVAAGTEVKMIVSTGFGDIVVPNFTGMTQDEATKAAEDAGLTIKFVEDADHPDPEGVIVSQDPTGGTTVEAGTEVVAQLSPAIDDAWVILTLSPNRVLTVSGINFQPGSTVDLLVIDTDTDAKETVQDDGSWSSTTDLSEVHNEAELLLVTGTAADGSAYEATFKIPAAGESTDEPTDEVPAEEESSSIPVWVWLVLGLVVIGIIALGIKMFAGGDSTGDDDTTSTDGDDTPETETPTTETS